MQLTAHLEFNTLLLTILASWSVTLNILQVHLGTFFVCFFVQVHRV